MGCPVVAPRRSDPELYVRRTSGEHTSGNGLSRAISAEEKGCGRIDYEVPISEIFFPAQGRTQELIMATREAKDPEIPVTALTVGNAGVPRELGGE